jgi:hypothetical protein
MKSEYPREKTSPAETMLAANDGVDKIASFLELFT